MNGTRKEKTKPLTVLKSVGPKLVPFFKTLAIYFVLFGEGGAGRLDSPFHCVIKCLPIVSLIIFVILHGLSLSEYYSYSRKVLLGLIFSGFGDAFLVWQNSGYLIHGLLMFAIAQMLYASAFGLRPLKLWLGAIVMAFGVVVYASVFPGLKGAMVVLAGVYITLICFMAWRAAARVQIFNDLWTWTKLCACAGALCFLISDTVIAVNMFVFPMRYSHLIIMTTYYAAQLGITLSVVDSQVDAFFESPDTLSPRSSKTTN
jgi:uncharacterized membrane protein YhhN